MNSTVPAPCSRRSAPPAPPPRPSRPGSRSSSSTQGASSMIFWWRRCSEHSRSPRCTTWPWPSARTWISMCRGRSIHRSTSSVSSPKEARASRRAAAISSASARRVAHQPHALAAAARRRLEQHRHADLPCGVGQFGVGQPAAACEPGTTGTPAACTVSLARILSPISAIASAGGPMKTSPASAQARAKAGVLGEEAVARGARPAAPVRAAASSSRSTRQIALGGGRRSDPDRRVGLPYVPGVRVRVAEDGDRAHAERAQGADDPDGDLAAVGDQDGARTS